MAGSHPCTEPDCDRIRHGHGLCRTHYAAWYELNRQSTPPGCNTPGCTRPAYGHGLCRSCYDRSRTKRGVASISGAERALRRGKAPTPPLRLPFRAVASSCPRCGLLRTTPDRLLRREAGRMSDCPRCSVRRAVAKDQTDADYRRRRHRIKARRQQTSTVDGAHNTGKQWTGPELETAARQDLTARQVAAMLGRTLAGVRGMRRRLPVDPRMDRLANIPRRAS